MQTEVPINLSTFLDTLTVDDIAKRKLTQAVVEVESNTSIFDTLKVSPLSYYLTVA